MSRTDRAVRRACRHLDAEESLIASALGIEFDGRRRQVLLLTDRRLLIVPLRTLVPTDVALIGCVADYDGNGRLLTIDHGDGQHLLRDVEEDVARRIVALLAGRRHRTTDTGDRAGAHVRIMDTGSVHADQCP